MAQKPKSMGYSMGWDLFSVLRKDMPIVLKDMPALIARRELTWSELALK